MSGVELTEVRARDRVFSDRELEEGSVFSRGMPRKWLEQAELQMDGKGRGKNE